MGKILYDNYVLSRGRNGYSSKSWVDLGAGEQIVWIELGDFVSSFIRAMIELKVEVP